MSAKIIDKLRMMGLLSECHNYQEIQGKAREKVYAWCSANHCPEYRTTRSRHRNVERTAIDCPSCGHALIWKITKHEVKSAKKVRPVPRSRAGTKH